MIAFNRVELRIEMHFEPVSYRRVSAIYLLQSYSKTRPIGKQIQDDTR